MSCAVPCWSLWASSGLFWPLLAYDLPLMICVIRFSWPIEVMLGEIEDFGEGTQVRFKHGFDCMLSDCMQSDCMMSDCT